MPKVKPYRNLNAEASRIIFGEKDMVTLAGLLRKAGLDKRYSTFANYRSRSAGQIPLVYFSKLCKARNLSDEEILEAVKIFY